MGTSYSKMRREIEKLEREKITQGKVQRAALQKKWEELQKTIDVLNKEVVESKHNNAKMIKALKTLWDGLENRNEHLIDEVMERLV